jgi:hypothetical protein
MDTQFWLGVGVTLVGGTIVTVLANLAHPKIVAYLDSRKLLSQEKRRRQAEKFHALILDLRTGRRDRHVYMLRVAVGVIVAFVLAIGGIVGAATTATVVMAIFPEASGDSFAWDPHKLTHAIIPLAMMFFGMFGMWIAELAMRRFREITNALEKFDEYDASSKRSGVGRTKVVSSSEWIPSAVTVPLPHAASTAARVLATITVTG